MSEAKHTPGPWDVDEGDFFIYQLETGDQIAEMFGHQTPEEVEANARLMASAPDMSAEITRLREENARLVAANKDLQLHFDAVREDLKKANEKNARLREALKPFAKMADELDEFFKGEEIWEDSDVHWIDCHQFDEVPTVGNLRAARAAIREGGEVKAEDACPEPDEAP